MHFVFFWDQISSALGSWYHEEDKHEWHSFYTLIYYIFTEFWIHNVTCLFTNFKLLFESSQLFFQIFRSFSNTIFITCDIFTTLKNFECFVMPSKYLSPLKIRIHKLFTASVWRKICLRCHKEHKKILMKKFFHWNFWT